MGSEWPVTIQARDKRQNSRIFQSYSPRKLSGSVGTELQPQLAQCRLADTKEHSNVRVALRSSAYIKC